jgi:hypothetical protein
VSLVGDSAPFSYAYINLDFSNSQLMNTSMSEVRTEARNGYPLLDRDKETNRKLIIGGLDVDSMLFRDVAMLYIDESEQKSKFLVHF